MDVFEMTSECLKKVQDAQVEHQKKVKNIMSKRYRSIGRTQILLSQEDIAGMVNAEKKKVNAKCSQFYDELNQARRNAGHPEIENPYKNK